MLNKLLISLGVLALTGLTIYHLNAESENSSLRNQFFDFKIKYDKSYGGKSELEYRFNVFKQTLNRINSVNSDSSRTHTAAVNKFSDLTFSEFKSKFLTKMNRSADLNSNEKLKKKIVPKKKDWRAKKGAVGKVKNQEDCGSCWAFSTVASLENAVWQKTKKSVNLSEQELVDCAGGKYENEGCNGGLMDDAYKYIIDNKIATEKSYPYRAVDQKCSKKNKKKGGRVAVSSFSYVKGGVNGLIKAAAKQVVSVAIEVQDDLMDYSSGVYTNNDPSCGQELNHGVAVVGYNTAVKKAYYIVRNSWGADWGLGGYFKIETGKGNGTCGIANSTNVVPKL